MLNDGVGEAGWCLITALQTESGTSLIVAVC